MSLLEECILHGIERTLQLTARRQNPEVLYVIRFDAAPFHPFTLERSQNKNTKYYTVYSAKYC